MDVENIKAEIQKKTIEQNTARLNISQTRERMEEEAEGVQSLKLEEQEIESKVTEVKEGKEQIQKELADSENLEKHTQEQIIIFQKELEEKREEESVVSAKVSEWELKVETMRQARDFKQANVDRITGEIEKSQSELDEVLDALKKNAEDVEQKLRNIDELTKTIEASYSAQNESETKLKDSISRKEELSAKQKNFFTSREQLSERMNALDKEVYRLGSQKEKIEETIESQINYMWDEYEITLSDAAAIRNEELTDLSGMKRDISSLKDQIKKLGDVNVNAIEDYKNLMERYTFMKTQHDDLIEAEKTLEGIIEELDTAMRKQFAEKFEEINKEFDKVFKELFGGGKGTLELMEDEDILEAGIRIIAQPPGKKLQNMMQLSGGEKALSAIALLFAIQNLKPSPFCLLDEIEAALDDSNVGRFAKYLHKLTKNTQFIVITHRRGTMEQVDRLYGITMQEKGVSALVSVNLIDSELDD
jgi:chromosome segregation protein